MTKHVELLLNMRSNRGEKIHTALKTALKNNDVVVDNYTIVKRSESLVEAIKKIAKTPPDILLIAGGDGTISTVIGHLSDTKITFGIVPTGTTNNFARSLGVPTDIDDIARVIADGNTRAIDIGSVDEQNFVNVVGVGISAAIAKNVSHNLKKIIGRAAYGAEGLRRLFSYKPFRVAIKDPDSELEINYETRQIIIANGRFHAGTLIANDSKIDSGELVVFPLGGRSIISFAMAMSAFYLFKRQSGRRSSFLHARHIVVSFSRNIEYERDGEPNHAKNLEVCIKQKRVRVLMPKKGNTP